MFVTELPLGSWSRPPHCLGRVLRLPDHGRATTDRGRNRLHAASHCRWREPATARVTGHIVRRGVRITTLRKARTADVRFVSGKLRAAAPAHAASTTASHLVSLQLTGSPHAPPSYSRISMGCLTRVRVPSLLFSVVAARGGYEVLTATRRRATPPMDQFTASTVISARFTVATVVLSCELQSTSTVLPPPLNVAAETMVMFPIPVFNWRHSRSVRQRASVHFDVAACERLVQRISNRTCAVIMYLPSAT